MTESGLFRLSLFRLIPVLMLVSFVAWCTSSRTGRVGAGGFETITEVVELLTRHGLVEGPVRGDQLGAIAKRIGPAGMNRLLYNSAADASLPALRWMVEQGAEPNNIGAIENLPLLHKVARRPQVERLEYFINKGLDPRQRDAEGRTLMHVCAEAGLDERVLALLVAKGLSTADATRSGIQAIHLASVKSIPVLAAAGADLAVQDGAGHTALHVAVLAGRHDRVTELLRFGASVFAVDKMGRTALHLAASARSEAIVDTLLAAGAPRAVRDHAGLTPRDLAGTDRQVRTRQDRERILDKL